jgi:hypothetical protein
VGANLNPTTAVASTTVMADDTRGAGGQQEPADLLRNRAQAAHILGDHDAAERLKRLATTVDFEVEYALNVDRGLPIVCRRTDAPKDATVGWYFLHDPAVRAERRRIGVRLPDVRESQ